IIQRRGDGESCAGRCSFPLLPAGLVVVPFAVREHGFTEGCSASQAAANDLHLWSSAVFVQPLPFSFSIISECHTENEIKARDPIRCRECGYRIMYKKRTKRCILLQNAIECIWEATGARCVRKLKMRVMMQGSFKAKNQHIKLP
uniref:RNA polymerase II, I and III subunit K n=1 Tax=Gallus gallus TaxID=9031 RepID=A0A8V0YFB2_CHICK